MALHISRSVQELIEFRLRDSGEVVHVEARFIKAVSLLVKVGERNAISQSRALKAMGVTDSDYHRRQWRHAVDFWQEDDVFVSATTRGYFIPGDEAERQRCIEFKETTIEALQRRKTRLKRLPLGKGFPDA